MHSVGRVAHSVCALTRTIVHFIVGRRAPPEDVAIDLALASMAIEARRDRRQIISELWEFERQNEDERDSYYHNKLVADIESGKPVRW